jgi:hypothetical protein
VGVRYTSRGLGLEEEPDGATIAGEDDTEEEGDKNLADGANGLSSSESVTLC